MADWKDQPLTERNFKYAFQVAWRYGAAKKSDEKGAFLTVGWKKNFTVFRSFRTGSVKSDWRVKLAHQDKSPWI